MLILLFLLLDLLPSGGSVDNTNIPQEQVDDTYFDVNTSSGGAFIEHSLIKNL